MSDNPRLDAVNTNVSLLPDEELYELYLKALGYPMTPLQGRAKEVYDESKTKRLLTLADAVIYFLPCVAAMNSNSEWVYVVLVISLIGTMMSLLNFTFGMCSVIGKLHYERLDSQPIEAPSMDSINLQSPQVLSFVADYLTSPLLDNARVITKQLQGERDAIERFIGQTRDISSRLARDRDQLTEQGLQESYAQRAQEAERTLQNLEQKRDQLNERIEKIQTEVAPIEEQVQSLRTLSQATLTLKKIQGLSGDDTGVLTDEAALDNFAGLSARVEMARQNLAGLGGNIQAYEQALDEVKQLIVHR